MDFSQAKLIELQGRRMVSLDPSKPPLLRIMSYNILAPSLIEPHQYPKHSPDEFDTQRRMRQVTE